MSYSEQFQGERAVKSYSYKFTNRIDSLRHLREVEILSRHLYGDVFDCTIGLGRFIDRLPKVGSYDGMDLSAEFVGQVKSAHPGAWVAVGDLCKGIDRPDSSYDCVICLRSLSAIGNLKAILPEMLRLVRPGGIALFDYGRKPTVAMSQGGTAVYDNEAVDEIVGGLNGVSAERIFVDALFTRAKRSRVARVLLNSAVGSLVMPDQALLALEKRCEPALWERQLILLRKAE